MARAAAASATGREKKKGIGQITLAHQDQSPSQRFGLIPALIAVYQYQHAFSVRLSGLKNTWSGFLAGKLKKMIVTWLLIKFQIASVFKEHPMIFFKQKIFF